MLGRELRPLIKLSKNNEPWEDSPRALPLPRWYELD